MDYRSTDYVHTAEPVEAVVANTDSAWFHHFRPENRLTTVPEVNFWRPRAQVRFKYPPETPFFFRLKHPINAIAGYGFFDSQELLPITVAWERFGTANGDPDFQHFIERIGGYRSEEAVEGRLLNCLIVRDAVFLPSSDWMPWGGEEEWARNIVAYKAYDLSDGPGAKLVALLGPPTSPEIADAEQAIERLSQPGQKGQRFQTSTAARIAVEKAAMTGAIDHYEQHGWRVEDVSAHASYDLHCTNRDGAELHVEVKGTTGDGSAILLTPNEVAHAHAAYPNVALIVVGHIEVAERDGVAHASGGFITTHAEPWLLDDDRLSPLGFTYRVNEPGDTSAI